jgi:glycosyltransferase involved in cell wall biosynthesis
MKIALVSYEYPPDSAFGGIATYMLHAATMLMARGHHVEVFAASGTREGTFEDGGVTVHRVKELARFIFPARLGPVFAKRHGEIGFDVVEAPEYFADAAGVIQHIPEIPLVVKLHSPSYMLWKTTFGHSRWMMIRNYFASLRRGELPPWHPHHGRERGCAMAADEVAAPCQCTADEVAKAWGLNPKLMAVVPNVYEPGPELLKINPATDTKTVLFIGRLELLKGVTTLAAAIPLVLKENPKVKFRFVGRSIPLRPGVQMLDHLRKKLAKNLDAVEFTGPVPLEQIPQMLAQADICAFPSIWDNFPTVCLEAMSAGRAVIGSSSGGMKEILDFGAAGRVIDPSRPRELADAILELMGNSALRIALGTKARQRVLEQYNPDRVGRLQEESYQRAIERRGSRPRQFDGPRPMATAS